MHPGPVPAAATLSFLREISSRGGLTENSPAECLREASVAGSAALLHVVPDGGATPRVVAELLFTLGLGTLTTLVPSDQGLPVELDANTAVEAAPDGRDLRVRAKEQGVSPGQVVSRPGRARGAVTTLRRRVEGRWH